MTRIKVNNSGKSQTRALRLHFVEWQSLKRNWKKKRNRRCFVEQCQRRRQRRMSRGGVPRDRSKRMVLHVSQQEKRIRLQIKYAVRVRLAWRACSLLSAFCLCVHKKDNKNDKITFIEKVFLFKREGKKRYMYILRREWSRTYGGRKKARVRPMLWQQIFTRERKKRNTLSRKKESLSLSHTLTHSSLTSTCYVMCLHTFVSHKQNKTGT